MSESFSTALSLMVIGMITVFFVLAIVVASGNLMIFLVNKFVPAEGKSIKKISDQPIKSSVLAAISAAVETFTEGKGKIIKIEKSKQ